eukprot:518625-Karenia_brevis.AAC.1
MMLRIMTTMHGGDGAVIMTMITTGPAIGTASGLETGPQKKLQLRNLLLQPPPRAPALLAFLAPLLLRRLLL